MVGEAYAILDTIGVENLDTRISTTESSIPNLKRYIYEHDSLEQLNILAERINKMSGRDADIFPGVLDMESVNGLDDIMKIANSLRDYELLPDISTPRELGIYLVESGKVECKDIGKLKNDGV